MASTKAARSAPAGHGISSIYWDWDLTEGMVQWNGPLERLLNATVDGGSRDRRWWEERIHDKDIGDVRHGLGALVSGSAERWEGTYRIQCTDGYVKVLDSAVLVRHEGRPHRIVGVLRRSVESSRQLRQSLKARLRQSEHRFETFVDSLPLLAWEADSEGWIDFYNRSWYEYTGTTLAEMEGWGWARVHDPLDLPRMLKVWRKSLEQGTPWEDEFRLRRADGALRWHLSRAAPLRDPSGRIIRWFGTNTDIHDQKLALEERSALLRAEQRLRREAEETNRHKDEFLAVVSHELRTPLSAVLGWTQLVQRDDFDRARLPGVMARIEQNGLLLSKLIEDLLDISRIISGKFEADREPMDPKMAIERAVESLKGAATERGVQLELNLTSADIWILGSPARVEQIASNLLTNAVKFSSAGQSVRVELRTSDRMVVLVVSDEGEGIDPEFLPQIFQRFRRADTSTTRRQSGLGLGLSIVHSLVTSYGGKIEASSEGKNKGATFRVEFPRIDALHVEEPRADEEKRMTVAPVSLAGYKVLGVDDDQSGRELLASVLLSCGATVTMAGSVAEAQKALRLETPDVIVSDLSMPEVDGYMLVRRLRESKGPESKIPVIALTAHASAQDRARALANGFQAYVSKPYDAHVLSSLIAHVAGHSGQGY